MKFIYFLILPVLLFYTALSLKSAQGPYYLNFEDPSYVYLINSLNVSLRYPVGHFDHPGTTVQVIGAITIRLLHLIDKSDPDLIKDVLMRPEQFLIMIDRVLVSISCLVLFFLGLITYRLSKDVLLSILIQLSPFISLEIFYGYKIVASDNFLITVSLCFTGALIYYLYRIKEDSNSPKSFILIFAIICALGLVTKISFFPLLLIPLIIIKGLKNKVLFLFIVSISFIVFLLPAISNYKKFIEWIWLLFLYTGNYGQGNPSVIDISLFLESLKLIFSKDPVFTAIFLISVITLVLTYLMGKKKYRLTENQKKIFRLLFAIILAVTLQIITVAKQYRQHYMIPSFILSVFSLSLCGLLLSSLFNQIKLKIIYLSIIVIITLTCSYNIVQSYFTSLKFRDEAYKVNQFVKDNNSNALVISSFGSASKEFSLAFGISYSGTKIKLYKSILSEIQPENIFFIPWNSEFFSTVSREKVEKELRENRKIIFQTNQGNLKEFIKTLEDTYFLDTENVKPVFSNSINEVVYEITIGRDLENTNKP